MNFIANQRFQGKHGRTAENKIDGGDGLLINPLLRRASLEKVVAIGGAGHKGGHGITAEGGLKTFLIDGSAITGGAAKKFRNPPFDAASDGNAPVGGDGVRCRAISSQGVEIAVNNSTITGGAGAYGSGNAGKPSSAGGGIKVIGAARITLNNASVASGSLGGNLGGEAGAIAADGGAVTVVKSLVKSHGGAAIHSKGPVEISVDESSILDGGDKGGIGILADHNSNVELSGTVKGGRHAVLFTGDNNQLSLRHGVNLRGNIAAAGKNNRLNLMSGERDENSFDLGLIGLADNRQGFSELHKTGAGDWTLQNNNTLAGGLEKVTVAGGSLTLDKTAVLTAGKVYNAPGAYFGGSGVLKGAVKNAGTLFMGKIKSSAPFQTLTLDGDYHGEDGSLILFNTRLGDDASLTDKLIVRGAVSGHSQLQITNLAGAGAATNKGILIIEAQDADPAAEIFSLRHRVVAGAYDYFLKREGNNWLLTTDTLLSPSVSETFSAEPAPAPLPPPKPPRTFTYKGPENDVAAEDVTLAETKLMEANAAETNQDLVTVITTTTRLGATPDGQAETSHDNVVLITDHAVSSADSTDRSPSSEETTAMGRSLSPEETTATDRSLPLKKPSRRTGCFLLRKPSRWTARALLK
ncbi:autotransporter outer membrane beta-barrel domain-containing protein [Acerihabitans sp. KWT182]|uniref:Autotransporter outer membrane beta-barrel domain-containing protein n=1 Tax=Acerihabitans sp. KWT182 TaxID=3157919 RepID=A0AAU7Q5L0_9GAMM